MAAVAVLRYSHHRAATRKHVKRPKSSETGSSAALQHSKGPIRMIALAYQSLHGGAELLRAANETIQQKTVGNLLQRLVKVLTRCVRQSHVKESPKKLKESPKKIEREGRHIQ